MKKRTRLFIAQSLIAICIALIIGAGAGCAGKLEQGGAYAPAFTNAVGEITPTAAPDFKLYTADAAFSIAYTATDAAFNFERNNREVLWLMSPDIKHELDKIRPQAVAAKKKWALARAAYVANPVPANLSALQQTLAEMQRLSAVASLFVTQPAPRSQPQPIPSADPARTPAATPITVP